MAHPIKYILPNLIIGRVYESKRERGSRNTSQFYRIEEKLSADFYRVTTHNPGKQTRYRRQACATNTLRGCALELLDFDQEPEGLQSEEGVLRRAERKRAERAARAAQPVKASRPPSTSGEKHRAVGLSLASGIWRLPDGSDTVRFGADGNYIFIYIGDPSKCRTSDPRIGRVCGSEVVSQSGVEYGPYAVTGIGGTGYQIKASPIVDTNLQVGLSHPDVCDGGAVVNGDTLTFNSACNGSSTMFRAANVGNSIVGVWAVGSATNLKTQHLTFSPDGSYAMADPLGDTQGSNTGSPGIEWGTYTHTGSNLTVRPGGVGSNTNGRAGILRDDVTPVSLVATLSSDGMTMVITEAGSPQSTLYRVSK